MTSRTVWMLLIVAGMLFALPVEAQGQESNEQQEQTEDTGWITVRPGDTLFSISRRHEVNVQDLRSWNNLTGNAIRAGMRLRIAPPENQPVDEARPDRPEQQTEDAQDSEVEGGERDASVPPSTEIGTVTPLGGGMVAVTIGEGETLYSLANRFALSADSLAALNQGFPTALESGMVVIVPDDRVSRTRTVKPGDTLFQIARDEGVSVARLRELNGISGSALRIGQELTIPSASVPSSSAMNLPEAGQFSIRPYPEALSGRTVSTGRTYQHNAFQIGHPSLPAGSIVLVSTVTGSHAFAEVIETAPVRRPSFIEGSRKLFDTLSLNAGDRVTLHRVR